MRRFLLLKRIQSTLSDDSFLSCLRICGAKFDFVQINRSRSEALVCVSNSVELARRYKIVKAGGLMTGSEYAQHIAELVSTYPIVSIEDPFEESDWGGWM